MEAENPKELERKTPCCQAVTLKKPLFNYIYMDVDVNGIILTFVKATIRLGTPPARIRTCWVFFLWPPPQRGGW